MTWSCAVPGLTARRNCWVAWAVRSTGGSTLSRRCVSGVRRFAGRHVSHHRPVLTFHGFPGARQLDKDYINLVGDALVSSSTIAYLGAFAPDFRQRLLSQWQGSLTELDIPHTPGCNVQSTLADPVTVGRCAVPPKRCAAAGHSRRWVAFVHVFLTVCMFAGCARAHCP